MNKVQRDKTWQQQQRRQQQQQQQHAKEGLRVLLSHKLPDSQQWDRPSMLIDEA